MPLVCVFCKIRLSFLQSARKLHYIHERNDKILEKLIEQAKWIKSKYNNTDVCPVFRRDFTIDKKVVKAELSVTAMGVYEAELNGCRVGDFFMAPGWTQYEKRHQYQTYDVTKYLRSENRLDITVGKGWYRGMLLEWRERDIWGGISAIIAVLHIEYEDGSTQDILTDKQWRTAESPVRLSEIYDGEEYDACFVPQIWEDATVLNAVKSNLIAQEGENVCGHEIFEVQSVIKAPNGETILDFGQNMAGYVEFFVDAEAGDIIEYTHGEILDKNGNFYTKNLRTAKQHIKYICKDGYQTYHPHFTFMGFRYIRLEQMPKGMNEKNFKAVAVYSDMERTGYFKCSDTKLNKLYENVIWGQKSNFIDVPTDCPQRDERLGWTGDAQMFVKTAAYNFNVNKFYAKWLRDVCAAQEDDGGIPVVVPAVIGTDSLPPGAAWGDAAVICPWQLYLTYGDKTVLSQQLASMEKWIMYMRGHGKEEFLWRGDEQFGDWLGMDAKDGSLKGGTNNDFIASAYFAYSVSLVIKSRKVLGLDAGIYEELYDNIYKAFLKEFPVCNTQTECVLALAFGLTDDAYGVADKLVGLIRENGNKLTTGFVGTPYLLQVLSDNGYTDLAYTLILQEEYPSWLFSVNMGATTIWEHWDGMKSDGSMWSDTMNSFNHYAYGSVAAWMYETILGIRIDEQAPGFENVILCPAADKRIKSAQGSLKTKYGTVKSKWQYEENRVRYEFTVPNKATVIINGKERHLTKGSYIFVE